MFVYQCITKTYLLHYITLHYIIVSSSSSSSMARSKTGPFFINHILSLNATAVDQASTIDISAYVDAGDSQGLEIMSVDYVWFDSSNNRPIGHGLDFDAAVQLKDTATGGLVRYDNLHLVSSGQLYYDSAGAVFMATDIYPDNLSISKGGGRVTVNDALEIVAGCSTSVTNLMVCARIQCRVVSLNKRDYMTLALQTVADN